jgi:hypothetical protein
MSFSLLVSIKEAIAAQCSAPRSEPANSAFLVELDRTDGAFDGIVVEFDAAVIDEAHQALPA